MRLDAFISQNTDLSRSLSQIAIKQGRVLVNSETARTGAQKISPADTVSLDNQRVEILGNRYLMLHKPLGYVCANSDADHPTVLDLLDVPQKHKLQIAGRLDMDTSGLVLLTDDGQWNHRVTAPKRDCVKTYLVGTADPIEASAIGLFASGVQLNGEKAPTLPAKLELISSHQARLSIQEGKYHQVKRMFAALGNRVVSLHREQIGELSLPADLAPGDFRPLTPAQILQF